MSNILDIICPVLFWYRDKRLRETLKKKDVPAVREILDARNIGYLPRGEYTASEWYTFIVALNPGSTYVTLHFMYYSEEEAVYRSSSPKTSKYWFDFYRFSYFRPDTQYMWITEYDRVDIDLMIYRIIVLVDHRYKSKKLMNILSDMKWDSITYCSSIIEKHDNEIIPNFLYYKYYCKLSNYTSSNIINNAMNTSRKQLYQKRHLAMQAIRYELFDIIA